MFCIGCLALSIMACNKDSNAADPDELTPGVYSGVFSRTGMDTAQVKLYVQGNVFRGETSIPNYPAICAGTYTLDRSTLTFSDTCMRTANFDWTLILDGSWNYTLGDDEFIRIWRTNNGVTDEYLLRRLVR